MPITLPFEARQYIDPSDPMTSVEKLTNAVSGGLIDLSVLKSFVAATKRSEEIRYSRTKPVPLLMLEYVRAHPDRPARQSIYIGLGQGLWSEDDVSCWESNAAVLSSAHKTSPIRGVYLTRSRRTRQRIARVSDQFVPKIAMDVVCSHEISDGAKACLAILLSLAGKDNEVVTYTASIGTLMGRTSRTVRNHFIALEEAGLITRTPGQSANTVRLVIHPVVRPDAYEEPADITAYRTARRSSEPMVQKVIEVLKAVTVPHDIDECRLEAGRKLITAFNLLSNDLNPTDASYGTPVPQARRNAGQTTHSSFTMIMRTDRRPWRNKTQKALEGALEGSDAHRLRPMSATG